MATGISFLARRGDDTDARHLPDRARRRRGAPCRQPRHRHPQLRLEPRRHRVAFLATPKASNDAEDLKKKGFSQEVFEEDLRHTQVLWRRQDARSKAAACWNCPVRPSLALWSPDGRPARRRAHADAARRRRPHAAARARRRRRERRGVEANLENPGKLGPVAWSPDGRFLAIVTGEDINDPAAGGCGCAPLAGGPWKDVLPAYMGHVSDVAWTGADTVGVRRQRRRRDGAWRGAAPTAPDAGHGSPRAAPMLDFDRRRRKRARDARRRDAAPSARGLRPCGRRDARPKRLTISNPWLEGLRLAQARRSSRTRRATAWSCEGILIRPLGEKPGAALSADPGRARRARSRTSRTAGSRATRNPGQVAAARGFAVFYPNYRGSTGRGVAFSKLGQGDAAGKEFDDLVDAVDHLVDDRPRRHARRSASPAAPTAATRPAWGSHLLLRALRRRRHVRRHQRQDLEGRHHRHPRREVSSCTLASGCGTTGTSSSSAARSTTPSKSRRRS